MSTSLARIFGLIPQLQVHLRDPAVTDIMVIAGGRRVFIEREGRIEHTDITIPAEALESAIVRIAHCCNDDVSEEQPLLDGRLDDGSRVAAMLPPCAVDGPVLTIRKFGERYTLDQLVERGSMPGDVATLLVNAIRARKNILISGGTGTGKTTLLNALADTIPDTDRIILIEDTSEILIHKDNLVRMESRRSQPKLGTEEPMKAITIADLVFASLRHRPDRIILGEVRAAEAWDLLQALNTGHPGSFSTLHANTAPQALRRLANLALMASGTSPGGVKDAIALAINLVVHIERLDGPRRVTHVLNVDDYDNRKDQFITSMLYPPPAARDGEPGAVEAAAATNPLTPHPSEIVSAGYVARH
jgi:pilus assembly protein CpaF